MTKEFSQYVFNIGVAPLGMLKEANTTLQDDPMFGQDIWEPLDTLGVDQFTDSTVVIKCRITTKPIRQWAVGREMNRRIKKTFDARGIEIPFPHRTLYWGPDQQPIPHMRSTLEPSPS